jgi:hypothetical protein
MRKADYSPGAYIRPARRGMRRSRFGESQRCTRLLSPLLFDMTEL